MKTQLTVYEIIGGSVVLSFNILCEGALVLFFFHFFFHLKIPNIFGYRRGGAKQICIFCIWPYTAAILLSLYTISHFIQLVGVTTLYMY